MWVIMVADIHSDSMLIQTEHFGPFQTEDVAKAAAKRLIGDDLIVSVHEVKSPPLS